MSKRANFFKIGLFVLAATALLVGGLILFGLREIFVKGVIVETCFNQTVQGLDVGSDVKFRGVKIGTVEEIRLLSAVYKDAPAEYGRWVVVRAKVEQAFFEKANITEVEEVLRGEVQNGLRAYLAPQGITGLVFLEFDYDSAKQGMIEAGDGPVLMNPRWKTASNVLYIPGSPGFIKTVMDSAQSISANIERFMATDFPAMSSRTISALERANSSINSVDTMMKGDDFQKIPAQIARLLDNLDQLSNEDEQTSIRRLLEDAQEITSNTLEIVRSNTIRESLEEMRDLLRQSNELTAEMRQELPETSRALRATLERLEYLLSSQQYALGDASVELKGVLRNLEELTATLKNNPSLILFSTDPNSVEPAP